MRWYPWLRPAFDKLIAQYQSQRGHHALLVHALPGMGDDALIYALTRWIMCQQPDGTKSCGHCRSCQLMQAGTHPDYYTIAPEKGKASIGIDAVRAVNEKLYEHARQGGARVIWVPDAGLLTEAAANALLKTLEEPPNNTWFFLGCREPEQLLATLRSRCLYWHLAPPEEGYACAWLNRETPMPHQSLLAALRLSLGAPGAAIELLAPERWDKRETQCSKLEGAFQQRDLLALVTTLNDDLAVERLHWIGTLLLDAIKWQRGAGFWITNGDKSALVQQFAAAMSAAVLHELMHALLETRQRLETIPGINRELLLTEFFINWEQMLAPDWQPPANRL